MNPDPAVVLAIIGISALAAGTLIAIAVFIARVVVPRLEGWCARRSGGPLVLLAMSEDAGLPFDAKQRAQRLLIAALDPKQRRSWHLRRSFIVRAASGRRYTISRYRPFNVRSGDALFCLQVHGAIPICDKVLAQKLLIEADEQLFLAKANVRTLSPSVVADVRAARAAHRLAGSP